MTSESKTDGGSQLKAALNAKLKPLDGDHQEVKDFIEYVKSLWLKTSEGILDPSYIKITDTNVRNYVQYTQIIDVSASEFDNAIIMEEFDHDIRRSLNDAYASKTNKWCMVSIWHAGGSKRLLGIKGV